MRTMSTKYAESDARVMSIVLIEGIAEVKHPKDRSLCQVCKCRGLGGRPTKDLPWEPTTEDYIILHGNQWPGQPCPSERP